MILYMYIALEQGLTTPWGQNFLCQQEPLVISVIYCMFQENLFEVWFCTIFFIILYMFIAPGQGQTTPRWQCFDVTRNVLSLHSFVASFKKMSLSLILYNFFHVYSPKTGADSPQGTKFWCQQEVLITLPISCKFQRNLFEVWFYTIRSSVANFKSLTTSVANFKSLTTIVSEKSIVLPFSHTKA